MGIQEVTDLLLVGLAFFSLCFLLSLKYLAELLTVKSTQSAVRFQDLKRFPHIPHVHGREQIAVGAGESLERSNTAVMQVYKVIHIVLHGIRLVIVVSYKPAPQRIINHRMLADLAHLKIKDLLVHQGRIIVKRHVDQCRTSGNRRRTGTRLEVFSVLKSRLVQMCVAVDDPREHIIPLCVDRLFRLRLGSFGKKRRILPVPDRDIRFVDTIWSHQPAVSNQ